jgi:hypothetical protein
MIELTIEQVPCKRDASDAAAAKWAATKLALDAEMG